MENTCKICCNKNGNKIIHAKEMMFGFRDTFKYIECIECGTVQIALIPENMYKYYPENYYSYTISSSNGLSFKDWRKAESYQFHFGKKTIIGAISSLFSSKLPKWMQGKYLKLNHKILDVGCGSGYLMHSMQRGGFTSLEGVDPYIQQDEIYSSGVSVYKKNFLDIERKYDFIMFHHSFEHMDHPLEIFRHIYACLEDNGTALIRIPVADSFSYKKYKENWVNLDPPRHFFLHTEKSIRLLSAKSGLKLIEVFRDANQFQFYGSELYLRNIPLEAYNQGAHQNFFTKNEIRKFRKEASRLNNINEGDWACFYLQKTN